MAAISAAMVKDLRDKTGAGMMDCKAALKETDGDVEAAVDWLRKKGLAKAAKKAGRTAADGLVAVATSGTTGVLVEVNAETDFVARNETFQKMVANIAETALGVNGDTDQLKVTNYPGSEKTIEEYISEMVGQIGENMTLRRAAGLSVDEGAIVPYIHTQVCEGAGKIGVIVALKSSGNTDALNALGKQIAMHVAAARPLSLKVEELDPTVVQREKDVLSDQARASGKPENIIEKMVEGRLRKFYEESVLLEQIFVIDGETKVAKVVENAKGDVGADVELVGFARFELGEGIEVAEDDFAAEVQAMAGGN
ncbi:MAG: translation elongation factor Ts [Aquisalinus sp.]|nr:translation elongation factor Ts [Aquisalinus sp.]